MAWKPSVAIVGAGGMGALFGSILQSGGLVVTLIDTNASKTIDVAFRNRLGEPDNVADLDVEVRHVAPKCTRSGPAELGVREHK